jgi:parvulin-like peptidyl-prolyl isomerase
MNKTFIWLLMLPVMLRAQDATVPDSALLIDTAQAVVFGQDGTQVITYTDVIRPGLAGVPRTLEDIIFERLVYLDAQKYKILADEDAVDKYLAMVQKENNLTLDQLKDVFASAGYSYEEGREQFKMLQTVNSMLDFKIRSHVIVPKQLVEKYYHEHPEVEPASYKIQIGFLPYEAGKEAVQKKALTYMAKTGKQIKGIEWAEPFWVNKDEIADDKQFIFNLKVGRSSMPIDLGSGYQIYKLVEKKDERVVPLEERYKEIADILRRPIYQDLMDAYKKQLFDTNSIVYLPVVS